MKNSNEYSSEVYEELIAKAIKIAIEYADDIRNDSQKGEFEEGMLMGIDITLSSLKNQLEIFDEDISKRVGLNFDITERIRKKR